MAVTGGLLSPAARLSPRCADVGIARGAKWASQWKVAVRTMTGFIHNDLLTAQKLLGRDVALRQGALNLILNFDRFASFAVHPAATGIKRSSRTSY